MFMRVNSKCAHQLRPPLWADLGDRANVEGPWRRLGRGPQYAGAPAPLGPVGEQPESCEEGETISSGER